LSAAQGGDAKRRMLGLVALAIAAAFVVTPQFLGVPGNPFYFRVNLRYVAPGMALGLALLPLVPALAAKRARYAVMLLLSAALLATQLDPSIWATELRSSRLEDPVRGAAVPGALALGACVTAAMLAVWSLRRSRGPRLNPLVSIAGVAAIVLAGGYAVQRSYFDGRYMALAPLPKTWKWAQSAHDQRIASVGVFLQYPFYGKDLSNHVQYLGHEGPHGAFSPIASCREWRNALNAGRYRYVVTAPEGFPQVVKTRIAREARWTASDPAAEVVLRETPAGLGEVDLFRIDGPLDPAACDRQRSAAR
jgi:hypothetical protein